MPLFVYAPPLLDTGKADLDKVHHVVAHHGKVTHRAHQTQTKKVPVTDARTLLPMNGGTTPAPAPVTPATTVAVQNPGPQGGNQQVVGPPIILVPDDAAPGRTAGQPAAHGSTSRRAWTPVAQLYFDAGAEDLIGSFTTLVLRGGIRYYDDELDAYARNETLDTVGTNLPFQQVIAGFSVGLQYRHWLMKNHVFFTISDGEYLSGPYKDQYDFRVGAVGAWGWQSDKMFTDIYTDLFYVNLLNDTIYTGRIRSGPILFRSKVGYVEGYGVFQAVADSLGTEGSENRVETGFGVGYVFMGHIALNIDMRAGYAFRGEIGNRGYLNPMIILSGSF